MSNLPVIRSEGFLAFLEIIDTLIAELNLDYSDIQKMNIQYEHIKKDDEILDSMESEIVEKSDSDKLSLETGDQKPKKKEEKKANDRILRDRPDERSKRRLPRPDYRERKGDRPSDLYPFEKDQK